MNNKHMINELNEYLKGEYMGIHAYEHYIQHAKDPQLKETLQKFQQDHKQHVAKISERIQDLGGEAVNDNGFMNSLRETMMNLKGYPDDTEDIVKEVIKGQQMGIEATEKIVRGDLDQETLHIVQQNLEEDRSQIDTLNLTYQEEDKRNFHQWGFSPSPTNSQNQMSSVNNIDHYDKLI